MSFITQVTISIVTYFIIRFSVKGKNSLYLSAIISSGIYIGAYLYIYDYIKFLPTVHFIAAGLCLLFLFIAYCEIVILERNIKKIKTGNLIDINEFSIEKNYRIVFYLLGIGLSFLTIALVSGFSIQSNISSNLLLKSVFTVIAWVVYLLSLIIMRYFNLSIKFATRGMLVSMIAVLIAYTGNSYIVYN